MVMPLEFSAPVGIVSKARGCPDEREENYQDGSTDRGRFPPDV